MKSNTLIITILIPFLCLFSCSRLPEPGQEKNDRIDITANAVMTGCDETKAPVFPSGDQDENGFKSMPANSTYGLFICKHTDESPNPYTSYSANFNNIKVTKKSESPWWQYTYGGSTDSAIHLILQREMDSNGNIVKDEEGKDKIIEGDMFAYAPYLSGVNNPEAIPFDINQQVDLMYCIENRDPVTNKKINPKTSPNPYTALFSFKHVFALLEFKFTLINPSGVSATLSSISVTKGNETAVLYKNGSLNAITGKLVNMSEGNISASLNTNIASNSTGGTAYLMMVPTDDYHDDDYIFTFTINGIQLSDSKFHLKKAQLKHGDADEYGFKAGYKYTFNFKIDNYIHFQNIEIGQWTEQDKPLIGIEI